MKIFSGSSNKPLAQKIADSFGLHLSPLEIFVFPDGERRVRVEEEVVGEHCVVVQSTCPPVDQNYMELFFIVDALKRSGAEKVTVVIPYFGYQRQDHVFRSGEVRSLEVVIRFLETVGVSRVIGFDFHSTKIPELFHIPVSHLSALPLFARQIQEIAGDNKEDLFLVSPDMGGQNRVSRISEMLDHMPFIATVKDRDLRTGSIHIQEIAGDESMIRKKAMIVDDMISSGKTMIESAELLIRHYSVEEVSIFATHPVFSDDASELLQNSKIKKVYVTDTVAIPKEKQFEKLEIISVGEEIAKELSESRD